MGFVSSFSLTKDRDAASFFMKNESNAGARFKVGTKGDVASVYWVGSTLCTVGVVVESAVAAGVASAAPAAGAASLKSICGCEFFDVS
ncbi:hypothetical protein PRIPAC_73378 [Pristionchus pacificus]|uniref:Uncharacterized protein n=1 Tax=Pristionchus pacificus TaxID=54126 RepID=A0A2A6B512_PRIPA|nr:hypothetical protein PRIPAC_73378 [Pristionchus pacificus]|eukprot:PDM60969.1 hypothetical protein PRIPAC_54775 [Pristionchus pacificus]